jgi:hypothetical protein
LPNNAPFFDGFPNRHDDREILEMRDQGIRKFSRSHHVRAWQHWRAGSNSIYAGFSETNHGPLRLSVRGFYTHKAVAGIPELALAATVSGAAPVGEADIRWPLPRSPGPVRELIVGAWQEQGRIRYVFRADGTVTRPGLMRGWDRGKYLLLDDSSVQLTFGDWRDSTWKILFYTADEMRLYAETQSPNTVPLLRRAEEPADNGGR